MSEPITREHFELEQKYRELCSEDAKERTTFDKLTNDRLSCQERLQAIAQQKATLTGQLAALYKKQAGRKGK